VAETAVGDYALLSDCHSAAIIGRTGAIDDPKLLEEQVQSIPWKRAAQPEELAGLAVFLASKEADYVTGSSYVMDGGLMQNQGQGA